jgi:FkbH-like protein
MRDFLHYPVDVKNVLRKRRSLREELVGRGPFLDTRVALLGGSTTSELRASLELFLLAWGIRPTFYESGYDRFYEEVMIDDAALRAFAPDIIVLHTTHHNIRSWPTPLDDEAQVQAHFAEEYGRFEAVWRRLLEQSDCLILQNNFDPPPLNPLGHLGSSAPFGQQRFVARLNAALAAFAEEQPRLRINDIHRLAALTGLSAWSTPRYWLGYKMAVTPEAAVALAHQTAKIVRAALGKTKKCLVLDLDNTLWGGVIGDEGVEGLRLGNETPEGEAYSAVQRYCKELKARGVLLAVCSKNDSEVARLGFSHPDSILSLDDFSAFEASWEPKPQGLERIARELNIALDSLVFLDDNPFERELVASQLPDVAVAKVTDVTSFAEVIDREGYFEPFSLTADDLPRAALYADNAKRAAAEAKYSSYEEYLASLEMSAEIAPFSDVYMERIAQLTNKTNQFNLTTRRYTLGQIAGIANNPEYVTLYGRLADRFGDNGVVSIVIGRAARGELHLDLWLMSCRVLKRTLELAMFDALCEAARARGVYTLVGRYVRTAKNGMVADHYGKLGFTLVEQDGDTFTWRLALADASSSLCEHIRRS